VLDPRSVSVIAWVLVCCLLFGGLPFVLAPRFGWVMTVIVLACFAGIAFLLFKRRGPPRASPDD
jgi:hypothetical protein